MDGPGSIGRRLFILTAGAALSGCGFQPVYMPTASGSAGVAQRELAAVHVNLMPDRPGQLLRQALQERLEMGASGVARRYDLLVGFMISGEGIAIQSDSVSTRTRLVGNATWTLLAQDVARTRLSNGSARAVDALNVFDSQYFAMDLEGEVVQRRLAEQLAEQITFQLAASFQAPFGGQRVKLAPQHVAAFLASPGGCRVVLLYGEDHGMIRDRAVTLVRAVAGSLDDPFRVAELSRDEAVRLAEEAASLSLTGGRRVVRLREATDAATDQAAAVLKGTAPALVVLEAPGLPTRSRLRQLVEAAPDGAAIACYPEEGRALADTIRAVLAETGVGIDADALSWLCDQLGADRVSTRGEIEKLALYVGPSGRVELDAAMACVGDLAGLSLDDALFAATEGDVARADRALGLAVAEGATPVGMLRAGLMHLQRLHRVRLAVDEGTPAAAAVKGARPPVFFRRSGAFTRAVERWSSAALMAAMSGLADAERACKRTGAPDVVLASSAILTLARRASAAGASRRNVGRNRND